MLLKFKADGPLGRLPCYLNLLIVAAAEDAKQIKEKVDKVKIERETAQEGELLCLLVDVVTVGKKHLLDFLCVPSRESGEDNHAGVA